MVYIPKIKKNVFPLYIPPEKDELFSSWYCRLSIAHGVKPLTFINNNFGFNAPVFSRDIDCLMPSYLINFFSMHTPMSKKRIGNLFVGSFEGYYFNGNANLKSSILSLGLNHRDRKRFGTMCCPSCLKKDSYYRKEWRLFSTVVCYRCKSQLIDRCPSCQKPISFHRIFNSGNQSTLDINDKFSMCWNCKLDFSTITIVKPSEVELQYQNFINQTIKKGYNEFSNYSFLFVNGLIMLCRNIRGSKNNKFNRNLNDLVLDLYKVELSTIKKETGFWSIEDRRETLPVIFQLIKEAQFNKEAFEYYRFCKSYLSSYNKEISYWILPLFDL